MATRTEEWGLKLLRGIDPETAHGLALKALRFGLVPSVGEITSPRLKTTVAGLSLPNPVGLAAGFDKNAEALDALPRLGFGFLEVGAATPRPQTGNARPRLFRLTDDEAVINRFGFNNEGAEAIADRLSRRKGGGIVGLNLGANKDSDDRAADYVSVLQTCGPFVDFATVNVSSPNTSNLRDLQARSALWALLTGVLDARAELPTQPRIFLKIAPDLEDSALRDIAEVAVTSSLDGIIATNTTIARPETLTSEHSEEAGGLSGAPLFEPSTRILAKLSDLTKGKIPIVGVGGIGSAEEAYAKIRAGASAVQLYSALTYRGPSLVAEIARGLDRLLEEDGYATVAEAVGTDRSRWLD